MASFIEDDFSRLDYRLLLNGPVNLFQSEAILDDCLGELKAIGYAVHDMDVKDQSVQAGLQLLGQRLNFPEQFQGKSLDAFNDHMRDVVFGEADAGLVIVLRGYDAFTSASPYEAHAIADIIAQDSRVAMLAGHRLVLLLQVSDGNFTLPALGATTASWNAREALASTRQGVS